MGIQVAEAFVKIRPDTKTFGAELKSGVTGSVASLAKTFAGLAIGAAVLKSWRDGVTELKAQQAAAAQTAVALRNAGSAAGITADGVEDLASSLSRLSGVDDEVIQGAENLILRFQGIRNQGEGVNAIFDRTTTAALDMSVAFGTDLASAAKVLGVAIDKPVEGMTRLRRAGIIFTEAQQELIQSLVASGDVLGAQKVILDAVEKKVQGSAEAYGKTLPGAIDRATVAMDNAKGAMLAGLAPALELVASGTAALFGWVEKLPGPLRMIATLAIAGGAGFVALARPINDVSALLIRLRAGTVATATATVAAAGATDVMTASLTAEAAAAKAAAASTTAAKVSMVGFAGILAAAAVAIYAAAKGMQFLFDRGTDLEDVLGGLSEDMGNLADDQLKSLVNESGELSKAFDIVAASMLEADPTTAIGRFEQMRAKMVELGIDTTELDGFIADAAASQRDLNDAASIGAGVIGDLDAEMAPLVGTGEALAAALGFVADEQERINDAIGDAFGAVTSAAEAMLNHTAANRSMETAMRAANAAAVDQVSTVDEIAEAHEDALQSVIDFGEQTAATYEANGASAQDARKMQIAALKAVADNPEFANIKAEIQALIAQYEAVPEEIPTEVIVYAEEAAIALQHTLDLTAALEAAAPAVSVTAYTAAANAALLHTLSLAAALDASVSTSVSSNSGGSAIAAASGYQGWITGPQTFVVGEGGEREYVSITPKSKMDASYPSAWNQVGGGTTNIYVTVTGGGSPEDTGRRIGNSAAETLRRRGLAVAARTG